MTLEHLCNILLRDLEDIELPFLDKRSRNEVVFLSNVFCVCSSCSTSIVSLRSNFFRLGGGESFSLADRAAVLVLRFLPDMAKTKRKQKHSCVGSYPAERRVS